MGLAADEVQASQLRSPIQYRRAERKNDATQRSQDGSDEARDQAYARKYAGLTKDRMPPVPRPSRAWMSGPAGRGNGIRSCALRSKTLSRTRWDE